MALFSKKQKDTKVDKKKQHGFVLSTYRTEVSKANAKSGKLEKFVEEHQQYGRYVCYDRNKGELIFSKEKGYLYGEHINKVKRKPQKYLYLEKRKDSEAIRVIFIHNGMIFFEGDIVERDKFSRQITLFLGLDDKPVTVEYYGLSEDALDDEIPQGVQKTLLSEPYSTKLKPEQQFLAKEANEEKKKRTRVYFIILLVFLLGASGYFLYEHHVNDQEEQAVKLVKKVDVYLSYKRAFLQPTGKTISHDVVAKYELLLTQIFAAWSIQSIEYKDRRITFSVSPINKNYTELSLLNKTAKLLGLNLQYDRSAFANKISLSFYLSKYKRESVKSIVPVQPQVNNFYQAVQLIYGKSLTNFHVKLSRIGVYKRSSLNVSLSNVTMDQITQLLTLSDLYPARISFMKITRSSHLGKALFFNVSFNIDFYGD